MNNEIKEDENGMLYYPGMTEDFGRHYQKYLENIN
jgi:hypothetical protein